MEILKPVFGIYIFLIIIGTAIFIAEDVKEDYWHYSEVFDDYDYEFTIFGKILFHWALLGYLIGLTLKKVTQKRK